MGKSKDLASGAAYQDQTESDTRYVNTAGDTMTGNLSINAASSVSALNIGNTSSDGTVDFTKGIVFKDTYGTVADVNGDTTPWIHAGIVTTGSSGYNGNLIFATDGDSNRNTNTSALTERMRIDHAGRVTTPNQPAFQAYSLSSGTSNADQVFPSTRINIGGHYSTSTGRFTAPVTGTYLFGWTNIANTANGTYRYYIRKNGSSIGDTHLRMDTTENGVAYATNAMFTWPLTCTANDYINIYFIESNNATNSYTSADYPQFWGYLIG
jgi:hypothetical protein